MTGTQMKPENKNAPLSPQVPLINAPPIQKAGMRSQLLFYPVLDASCCNGLAIK
jgi:hypothetical protein